MTRGSRRVQRRPKCECGVAACGRTRSVYVSLWGGAGGGLCMTSGSAGHSQPLE